jgi:hypothetical protein
MTETHMARLARLLRDKPLGRGRVEASGDVGRLTDEDEAVEGPWHCQLCADGGLTPWPEGTECPNYPCQAYQPPVSE